MSTKLHLVRLTTDAKTSAIRNLKLSESRRKTGQLRAVGGRGMASFKSPASIIILPAVWLSASICFASLICLNVLISLVAPLDGSSEE